MILKAMAKINLGLDVVGKRPDGYHEVRMIMQSVCMYDKVELTAAGTAGIHLSSNLNFLPRDENNLAVKAAGMLMREFDIDCGLNIRLTKMIPVAAGLAGGSSDAAAVLVGVNRLFSLGLGTEELMKRGALIGSDVPYCILRGTALAEGLGEKLTPLPPMPQCYILIAKPGVSVSTRYVYQHLHLDDTVSHPDIDGIIMAVREGSLAGITERLGNVLETVTIPEHPVIEELKQLMMNHGAMGSLMSGSGPTVFGIFDERSVAECAAEKLKKSGLARRVFLTRPFQSGRKWNDKR